MRIPLVSMMIAPFCRIWEKSRSIRANRIFFYFHFVSTHQVGYLQDEYRLFKPDESDLRTLTGGESQTAMINQYDNRILQVNALLRQLYTVLKEKRYLENAVIILTSDHGQSLGEGGRTGHVTYLQKEAISIPLIIFDDPRPYNNKWLARQIDIAPTILERLGYTPPSTWEGKSLLDPLEPTLSFHENATARARLYSIILNDSTGIYRYLFSEHAEDEELGWIGENNVEVDKKKDTALLARFRSMSQVIKDTAFNR